MTGQHLDLDQLAHLLADGYDAAPSLDPVTREHAGSCPTCAAGLRELQHAQDQVSVALASLPDPPLPAGLAARLEEAVARERGGTTVPTSPTVIAFPPARPLAPTAQAPVTPPTVVPLVGRRPRWQPWAAGAAAAAVLGTGAVLLTRPPGGGLASTSSARSGGSNAGQAPAGPAVPTSSSGTDYRGTPALAAALPALLRGAATAPGPAAARSTHGSPTPAPGSATRPSEAVLGAAASAQLDRLRNPRALADCVAALQDPGSPVLPLALDYARYAGAPALVVILPSTRPGKVDVYAVGAGCSRSDARVLAFSRLTAR